MGSKILFALIVIMILAVGLTIGYYMIGLSKYLGANMITMRDIIGIYFGSILFSTALHLIIILTLSKE